MSATGAGAAWSMLVRAALLGTDRAAGVALETEVADEPQLAALLGRLTDRTAESRLLGAAAVVAQYRRVGDLPVVTAEPLVEPAPAETARICPPGASIHLRTMLDGTYREALAEWLGRAVANGLVAAPEDLPRLLEAGWDHSLRDLIGAAAGARGRWLAALNPAWSYAVASPDDLTPWETGTTPARLALLRGLRGRDPDRALALLRTTWASEAPPQRALFLPALERGLTMADEPFLEEVLDDRRKEVRTIAAGLLARLPASRLVARMTERVLPLVRIDSAGGPLARALGRTKLVIELPAACDTAMVRDGIEPKPPRALGERAWWLAQMLAAVPPSVWSGRASVTPAQCIGAAARTEWRELLVHAWSIAAARMADPHWAEALLVSWAGGEPGIEPGPLAATLPTDRFEAVVTGLIENASGEVVATEPGLVLVASAEHGWTPALTRTVMRRLATLPRSPDYAVRALLARFALRMHAATAIAEADHLGEGARGPWLDLLHHRHAMLEALDR